MQLGIQRLVEDKVVLKEVIDALSSQGRPVKVICSPRDAHTNKEVKSFLKKHNIEVTGDAGNWIFAIIKNSQEAEKIEKAQQEKRTIDHFWLDKPMTT